MFSSRAAFRTMLLAAVAAVAVTGCSQVVPRPKVQTPPETGRVTFAPEQSVIDLESNADHLLSVGYDKGDPLPGDNVGPVEVTGMPLQDVLRLVTRAHKIPVAVGSGAESATVSISIPDQLPLAKIIDMLVEQADAFYQYRDGVLHVEGTRHFSIRVPNVLMQTKYKDLTEQDYSEVSSLNSSNEDTSDEDRRETPPEPKDPREAYSTLDAFTDTITSLGAESVTPNNRAGLLTFIANRQSYKAIADFMRDFELNRDLIVYDAWIYEVKLSDAKKAGIDWEEFRAFGNDLSIGSKTNVDAASVASGADAVATAGEALRGVGGMTLGVMGTPGAWAVEAMFEFLNTQGEAKTLAQPMISVIGGRESQVYVGEAINYIRSIGIDRDGNATSSNDDSGDDSDDDDSDDNDDTDVETMVERLRTGIKLGVTGDVINGVVESDINLSFVELLSLNNLEFANALVQIPHTAERSLSTTVRARPGDVIMLGGLIYDTGKRSQDNLMLGDIPMEANAESTRTELVVLMRPRLIKFHPSKKSIEKAFEQAPVQVGPETLPAKAPVPTDIKTPAAPEGIGMKKSSTTEQQVIEGIKAAPDLELDGLADDAKKAIDSLTPDLSTEPLPAPANKATTPATN